MITYGIFIITGFAWEDTSKSFLVECSKKL